MRHYFANPEAARMSLCGASLGPGDTASWANALLAGTLTSLGQVPADSCRLCLQRVPELLRTPIPSAVDQLADLGR